MKARLGALACLAAVVVAAIALVRGHGEEQPPQPALRPAPEAPRVPPVPREAPHAVVVPPGPLGARIIRRTQLRRSPGGPVVRSVGTTTGYGSERLYRRSPYGYGGNPFSWW